MSKTITRKYIQRITKREGNTNIRQSSGGGGGGGGASQYWVEENYISKLFFNQLFTVYDEDGNVVEPNDTESVIASIKSMFGFWTDAYLSALGNGEGGGAELTLASLADVDVYGVADGQALVWNATLQKWVPGQGGGIDITAMWAALAQSGVQQIDASHLATALTGYATETWVGNQGYITGSALNGYATESWVGSQISDMATQTWVSGNYLSQNNAAATYLTQTNAAATYLTKSDAATTYVSIAFFERLFKAYNGSTVVHPNNTTSTIDNIKAMFGFWTDFYLSALGNGSGGSTPGVTMAQVWSALSNSTTEQINISHLTTALSGYITTTDLATQLASYNPTNNFKTINGNSIIGTGDINVGGGGGSYLPLSGGTMTGFIDFNSSYAKIKFTGTVQSENTEPQYFCTFVDNNSQHGITYSEASRFKLSQFTNDAGFITGSYLPLAGGTMTGTITTTKQNTFMSVHTSQFSALRFFDINGNNEYAQIQGFNDSTYYSTGGSVNIQGTNGVSIGNWEEPTVLVKDGFVYFDGAVGTNAANTKGFRVGRVEDYPSYLYMQFSNSVTGIQLINQVWSIALLQIDNSGNLSVHGSVGIGTTSPSYKLDVNGDVRATNFRGALVGNADSATKLSTARTLWGQSFDGSANVIGNLSDVGHIQYSQSESNSRNTGGFRIGRFDENLGGLKAQFGPDGDFGIVNNLWSIGLFTFKNNGNFFVYGNVGVGVANPSYKVDVNGDVHATNFRGALVGNADTATKLQTARTLWGQSFDGSANVSGSITGATTIDASSNVSVGGTLSVTGNSTLTGYVGIGTAASSSYALKVSGVAYASTGFYSGGYVTALSDARHKDVKGDVGLTVSEVANAPSIKFLWKDRRQEGMQVGSIAQYWKKVMPEAIVKNADGELTMSYGVIALLASIATARKVEDHERRIRELEEENKKLKQQLNAA